MAQLVLDLADKVSALLSVKRVYADPVVIDETTVIPVSVSYAGFGAGEGGDAAGGHGGGGGGGGVALPVGAYIARKGEPVHFEPNLVAVLAVSTALIAVSGRLIVRLVRAARR